MIPRRWTVVALLVFLATALVSMLAYRENLAWPHSRLWSSGLMNLGGWFVLLPSALGGWAAWQGWRHRRTGIKRRPAARAGLTVLVDWYRPAILTSLLAPLAATLWMAPQLVGLPRLADLVLVPIASASLLCWTLVGALLGRLLPLPVALALGVMLPFLGTAFPEAQNSFTYRHVLALHSACCLIDKEVDPRIPLGSGLFFAVALVALGWALARAGWARLGISAIVTALAFQGSASVVRPLNNPDGVRPRPVSALVCVAGRPTICLWPEQSAERASIRQTAERIRASLEALGVSTPAMLSSDPDAEWNYVAGVSDDDLRRQRGIIGGLVWAPMPACATREPWYMSDAYEEMSAWVWVRAGFDAKGVRLTTHLAQVLRRSDADQAAWFSANMQRRSQCGVEPLP